MRVLTTERCPTKVQTRWTLYVLRSPHSRQRQTLILYLHPKSDLRQMRSRLSDPTALHMLRLSCKPSLASKPQLVSPVALRVGMPHLSCLLRPATVNRHRWWPPGSPRVPLHCVHAAVKAHLRAQLRAPRVPMRYLLAAFPQICIQLLQELWNAYHPASNVLCLLQREQCDVFHLKLPTTLWFCLRLTAPRSEHSQLLPL